MNLISDKDKVLKLRQEVLDSLLRACRSHYHAELALGELYVPEEWKDNAKKAYAEFIWRYQDYELVNESDEIDLDELNFKYE